MARAVPLLIAALLMVMSRGASVAGDAHGSDPNTKHASRDPCRGKWLGDWLDCNNPRVVAYLGKLRPRDVGRRLRGVTLSDGKPLLRGEAYVGEVRGLGKGQHAYIVERDGRRHAFVWVDRGGDALALPSCPSESVPAGPYVLSGDVYTWKAAQPGDGVIEVECVDESWSTRR